MTRRAPNSVATADDVLRYVAGYLEAHGGVSPSYQDICDALGFYSKCQVNHRMREIEASGRLLRMERRYRAMALTEPVEIPRAPDGAPLYFVRIPQ